MAQYLRKDKTMDILWTYLNEIESITTLDKEHQHRTALENLFNQIKEYFNFKNIQILHEPNNDKTGLGAPDFLIKTDGLILGYIENKRVNTDFNFLIEDANKNEQAQIARYLKLSPNLILTDYLQFLRVSKNEKNKIEVIQKITICELFELQHLRKLKSSLNVKEAEFLEFFKSFFSLNPNPIQTAKEFANALALRTRELNNTLLNLEENKKIKTLYSSFREILYKDLSFSDFCDSFAQTLTYSLFLAKLNDENNREIDLYNVKKFIPKSFPLIRAMSGFLDELEDLNSIEWLIKEILNIINHIEVDSIIKELNKSAEKECSGDYLEKDPYLHFYETFLSQYNPQMRELRGVYYTPFAVVRFIINAIDEVLKTELKEPKGLSAAVENDNITLLDFATGTGTFLLEALRKALEAIPQNSPKYNPKNLIPNFSGFELLVAPYTVAHLKISQAFKEEFHTPLNNDERLNIFLTNTLYNPSILEQTQKETDIFYTNALSELNKEFLEAKALKEKEILIITGNPPYSGASANKGLFENEIKETYGKEPNTNEKLKNEKTTKWILDDYVKFIRFSESKLEKQKKGILAFISNNGFLNNPTFRGMRFHLMQTFDKIYILDLHGSVKKKEKAPDGSNDGNVFDIQTGSCISIFVKTEKKKKNKLAEVFHYDLFGKRQGKYNFLLENNLNLMTWNKLNPQTPFYLFIPQNEKIRDEYNQFLSVRDIFIKSGGGICSQRDNIVFQKTKKEIKKLLHDFSTKDKNYLYAEYKIGDDSRDWKLDSAQKAVRENIGNFDSFIMQCHYRPFDFRWTYYVGKSRAFMAYPVFDIFQHFSIKTNKALLISRQESAMGDENPNPNFVTNKIVDLNFYRRGGVQVLPLYLDSSKITQKDLLGEQQSGMVENFTESFRKFIDEKYQTHFSPEIILGYIYAVLYHQEYRTKYIDFLKIDFPKIPFVDDKKVFQKLSDLGNHLIDLHLMKIIPNNHIGEPLFEKENRNTIIEKNRFDENKKRLFINESLYFDKVEKAVWEYKIGGYQVLDKYLKSHKNEIIDFEHFENIIKVLSETLKIEKEIAKIDIFPR